MRFLTPDDRTLRIDRVGGFHTYAARLDSGSWTALGELRTVIVAAVGLDPDDPWVARVVAAVEGRAAPSDDRTTPLPTHP